MEVADVINKYLLKIYCLVISFALYFQLFCVSLTQFARYDIELSTNFIHVESDKKLDTKKNKFPIFLVQRNTQRRIRLGKLTFLNILKEST